MGTRKLVCLIAMVCLSATLDMACRPQLEGDDVAGRRTGTPSPAIPSASDCEECHADTVAEWRSSAHAFAADNPLIHAPVCGRCHAPLGVMFDPDFMYRYAEQDPPAHIPAAASEGVTCVVCHAPIQVPSRQVLGLEPEWPNWRTTDLALRVLDFDRALGTFGTGTAGDELPVHQDFHASASDQSLARAEFCRPCHDLVIDKGALEAQLGGPQPLVRLDATYEEWAASSFRANGVTCQTCHMPRRAAMAPAAVAPAGRPFDRPPPPRRRTDHSFPGVHSAYWLGDEAEQQQQQRAAALLEGIATLELVLPSSVSAGDMLDIVARVRNVGVGHDLPSGYAFWRELWLELRVEDAAGRLLFGSGLVDESGWLPDEHNPAVRRDPSRYDPYLWSLRARLVRSPENLVAWMGSDRWVEVPTEVIRRNHNGTPILGTSDFDVAPILAQLSSGAAPVQSGQDRLEEVYTLRYGEAVIKNGIPADQSRQARYGAFIATDTSGPVRVSARLLMRPLARSMTSQQEELAGLPPPGPIYEIVTAQANVSID